MGDRYYITGVQLGCLMSQSLDKKEIKHILDEVHEKQFLCNDEGFKKLKHMFGNCVTSVGGQDE